MKSFSKLLDKYDYSFSKGLIAQEPANPRDSAKLLVYKKDTGEICIDTYRNIGKYLTKDTHLVFNQTRVVPARLIVKKATGGKAKLLYIGHSSGLVKVISDRKLKVGSNLALGKVSFKIARQEENFYFLQPSFPMKDIFVVLEKYGITPIPPYIKHSPLSENKLRQLYQTVFARTEGSVAAPTASLHFTNALLKKLRTSGVKIHFVTLHVNMGTFAPLAEKNFETGKLHKEYYEIDAKTAKALTQARAKGKRIIGVGTTVVRTLESAANGKGELKKLSGTTQLFISHPYKFKFIDGMATNFHVPRSSLLMLVAALIGREKLMELYKLAISKGFRLFSFGDGMLVL